MPDDHTVWMPTPWGEVQIVSALPTSRRDRTRADAHRQFLSDHWPELSAASFAGYRQHGTGAVVRWRESRARRFRPRAFQPARLWYVTQIHALLGTTEADFDGWEAHQSEAYNPRAEGVVVFVGGGGFTGYRVSGRPVPLDAHRLSAAALN